MNTTAIPISRLPLPSRPRLLTRLPDFVALMKPRVMALAVFTALVGLIIAPAHLDPLLGCIAILAIAAGAGAAGVLNMWYDADIDRMMTRTAMRPIPRGEVSRGEAFAFGLVLAGGAVAVLGVALNATAAALLAFTIFFYVAVYTAWLKRATPQNIVIGGAAGALPPVIGWASATGQIGIEPLVLFLIIFLWTPPHFWALSLNRAEEYARAGIPMLPVVAGRAATKRQIVVYSALLLPISLLPWALGFAGSIYGATAAVGGALLIGLAARLSRSRKTDRRSAHRLFVFSIFYLFLLFAALLAGHRGDPRLSVVHSGVAGFGAGVAQADAGQTACRPRTDHSPSTQMRSDMRYRPLIGVLVCAAALGGCSEGVLDPKGTIAVAERQILFNSVGIMLAIVIPTILATLAVAYWFRASNARASYRPDFVYSGRLEVLVWSIPAMTVLLVGGVAWVGAHDLDPRKAISPATKPVTVQVVSLDWKWLFIYPEQGVASVNHLVVPAGTPISFELTSSGVMNSFFVPQLGSQIYTMSGMTTHLQLQADHPGSYQGLSAQFSGDGFADMHFVVDALPAKQFDDWVAETRDIGTTLDARSYGDLAKPSEAVAPFTYRAVSPGLFNSLLSFAMADDPLCTSPDH